MQRQNYQVYDVKPINIDKFEQADERKKIGYIYDMPSNYNVYKTSYKHKEQKNTWAILKVEIEKDGEIIFTFYRNYPSLSIIYVSWAGKDYFITSEDYQCISIIDVEERKISSYVDIDDIQHGCGFCPIDFDWDEDVLYVEGCIWGCPYETMICRDIDLNNPIEAFNNAEYEDDYEEEFEPDDDED